MNTISQFAIKRPGFLMAIPSKNDPTSPTRKQEDPPATPAREESDPDASPSRKQEDPIDAPAPGSVETPEPPGINRKVK